MRNEIDDAIDSLADMIQVNVNRNARARKRTAARLWAERRAFRAFRQELRDAVAPYGEKKGELLDATMRREAVQKVRYPLPPKDLFLPKGQGDDGIR